MKDKRTRYIVDPNDVMSKRSSSNFGSNFKIYLEEKNGCGSVASQTASFPSRFDDATHRNVRYTAQARFIHGRRAFIGQAQVNPKHSGLHTIKKHAMCTYCGTLQLVNGLKNANSMTRKIQFLANKWKTANVCSTILTFYYILYTL